jgi:hypothetical protein
MTDYKRELQRANFHQDRLGERLALVDTAVVEMESALSCDGPDHWRAHIESALLICKRATRKNTRPPEGGEAA